MRSSRAKIEAGEAMGSRLVIADAAETNLCAWLSVSTAPRGSSRRSPRYRVQEAPGANAVPVLRKYISEVRVTRPSFDAAPDSPDEVIADEVAAHPIFRREPLATPLA